MSTPEEAGDEARRGWDSDFVRFASTPSNAIVAKLRAFLANASREQLHAWDDSVPRLQSEVLKVREAREQAARYTAILEYELPLESRRTDAIFLLSESVVVIELKGKAHALDADIDQAHAYARDLRCYHAECEARQVHALLVPTGAQVIWDINGVSEFAGLMRSTKSCASTTSKVRAACWIRADSFQAMRTGRFLRSYRRLASCSSRER